MKNVNNKKAKILKAIAKNAVKVDANSTSCIVVYQPKVPSNLKQFSKIENDK